MKPLLLPLPGNEAFAKALGAALDADIAPAVFHRFPDGETYVRIESELKGRTVVLVCTLDRADEKYLPLIFAAATARELGAAKIGLVAPYLGYMRQDARFRPGEAVTSRIFASELSRAVDWLVTVDPHLHRWPALSAIYGIPAVAVHAAPLIAGWIGRNVNAPFLIGPDEESDQWVCEIACGAPHAVLKKTRRGDTTVEIELPANLDMKGRTPVFVDDIISSGRTMIAAAEKLRRLTEQAPACVGIHAVFADDAYSALKSAGLVPIVTTNTIAHETNALDVSALVADAVRPLAG
jgi:ribose-phosphate pyrophosphokinase